MMNYNQIHDILEKTKDLRFCGVYDFNNGKVISLKRAELLQMPSFEKLKIKEIYINGTKDSYEKLNGVFWVDFSSESKLEFCFPFSYDIQELNPTPDDVRDAVINILLETLKNADLNVEVDQISLKCGGVFHVYIVDVVYNLIVVDDVVSMFGNDIQTILNEYKKMYYDWYEANEK